MIIWFFIAPVPGQKFVAHTMTQQLALGVALAVEKNTKRFILGIRICVLFMAICGVTIAMDPGSP
jgi:hypothetical protein